jgi:50S ribosomal subunit-associated GTPase HflX
MDEENKTDIEKEEMSEGQKALETKLKDMSPEQREQLERLKQHMIEKAAKEKFKANLKLREQKKAETKRDKKRKAEKKSRKANRKRK